MRCFVVMRPLYVLWGAALFGCSFHPGGEAAGDDQPTTIDAPAIADIDGPAAEIDAPPRVYAATCAELGASAADTDVTLYFDKDPNKPWAAHCRGEALRTYLVLGANSTSSYPTGGCASLTPGKPASVVTTWTMVKFDPATGVVSTGDFFGATSTGGTHEVSGNGTIVNDYPQVPFAAGRSCSGSKTVGTVDLRQSHFAIAQTQQWYLDGFMASGNGVTVTGDRKQVTIQIGGNPVGGSGCGGATDYYTLNGGDCLTLAYAP